MLAGVHVGEQAEGKAEHPGRRGAVPVVAGEDDEQFPQHAGDEAEREPLVPGEQPPHQEDETEEEHEPGDG